jgi:phosphohistidine phosphatase
MCGCADMRMYLHHMRTLVLIRHAKSSWENFSQADFDRPLNERGKKDAPEMAARVKEKGIVPDHILSSPAKRAKKTAKLFAEVFDYPEKNIEFVEALYNPSRAAFLSAVTGLEDAHKTVCVFSHNPDITEFANSLTNVRVDDMPTCAVFAVSYEGSWKELETAEKKFLFFDYPKNPL